MKTRLLLSISLLLGIAAGAQAYTLKVGGVSVSSSNASNVTGDNIKAYSSSVNGGKPSVVYNEQTKTLTLWNVKIDRTGSGNRAILNEDVSGLTIILKGTNYLKAANSSPVRLNAQTTMKCQAYNGQKKTYIYGGSEDALTVVNSSKLIIEDADLYLESESSCFDASGSPSLYIKNSTVTAKCTKNKSNDCYALFDYKLLFVNNSTVSLTGYTQAVKNLTTFDKATRIYVKTPSGGKFDSSQKTFVSSSGTIAGTVVLDIDNETGLSIDISNFPDYRFCNYVAQNCDPNGNGILSDTELKNVKTIDVKGLGITRLKGIEKFTELTVLNCSNNKLSALDVSKNTKLGDLRCTNNQLTSLNVNSNTQLVALSCGGNQLTTLNLTYNTRLMELNCNNNSLQGLNLTKNTALITLNCYANKIDIDHMATLIASLPKRTSGTNYLGVVASSESSYGNKITTGQVQTAAAKGWTVSKWTGSGYTAYTGIAPEKYGLQVGGVDVSYDNCSNVTGTYIQAYSTSVNGGKPSVSYVPSTKTLTLWNVKIERTGTNNRAILNDDCPGLKIVLKGQNSFTATDAAPVKLNKETTISSSDGEKSFIKGGAEDAFYVGSSATITLSGVKLSLTSESSCFDTSGSPTLIVENSTINAGCFKNKSGDSYALFDFKELSVKNSNITLEGYSQAVKNLSALTLGPGMYIDSDKYGKVEFVSGKKTFHNKYGNPVKIVELLMGTDLSYKGSIYDGMKWDQTVASLFKALKLEGYFSVATSGSTEYYKDKEGKVICTHDTSKGTLGVPADVTKQDNIWQSLSASTLSALNADNIHFLDGYDRISLEICITINEQNFPDKNLRNYVKKWDYSGDGRLQPEEASDFRFAFDIRNLGVTNLKGIEYFTGITELNCGDSQIPVIDLRNCTMLEKFTCFQNFALETLLVAGLENLTKIDCTNTLLLKSLDLTGCKALTSIDVSHSKLEKLFFPTNDTCPLEYVDCSNGNLKSLSCSNCQKLQTLICSSNQLESLETPSGYNSKMTRIECNHNKLTTFRVPITLSNLECYDNLLTELEVNRCDKLSYIDCRNNCIKHDAMTEILQDLYDWNSSMYTGSKGRLVVYDPTAPKNNEITPEQVEYANSKKWDVLQGSGSSPQNFEYYEGMTPDGVPIDETNFPDSHFCRCIKNLDPDRNGYLTDEEIQEITEITLAGESIESIEGIGIFTNLMYLDCCSNKISMADLSGNKKLQVVKCYNNQIYGKNTDNFISSLPTTTEGELYFLTTIGGSENNSITKQQKAAAEAKGWSVLTFSGSGAPTIDIKGDANGDGEVNALDVATVRDYILGLDPQPFSFESANLNGDSEVDIQDLTQLIEILLKR